MSHLMDLPLVHNYRGRNFIVKFGWQKPNDQIPAAARVVIEGDIKGLGEIAFELAGPWDDYQQAASEAIRAAEDWVDQHKGVPDFRTETAEITAANGERSHGLEQPQLRC